MAVAHGSRPPGAILPASGAGSQYSFALALGKMVPPPAQASPTLIAVTRPQLLAPTCHTYVHYSKAAPAEDPLQGQGQGRRRQPQRVPWDGGVPRGISSQPTSSHRVVWVGAVTAGVRKQAAAAPGAAASSEPAWPAGWSGCPRAATTWRGRPSPPPPGAAGPPPPTQPAAAVAAGSSGRRGQRPPPLPPLPPRVCGRSAARSRSGRR